MPYYPPVVTVSNDLPTGVIAETLPRGTISSITLAALTSAQLFMQGVFLTQGQLVSNISWVSGSTAGATLANQWSALYSGARVQRAISADDTSNAWAANSVKTFAMTTPFTVTTTGIHYVGLLAKATVAVPTLQGILVPNTTVLNLPPILCGNADAGLTNPASGPATAATITVAGTVAYAYVT